MHADRHHFWSLAALCIQHIKRIAQIFKEVLGRIEPLRGCKAHVVGIKRVRYDQLLHH